jgi:meiotic recombination protein SPO11
VATRQWVHHLHNLLQIPVVGLCDCNPYGISVLNTYQYQHGVQVERAKQQKDQREESNDSTRNDPTLHLQWIGLRPSQIETLDLPKSIFQALTELDKKRLKSLLQEDHPFAQQGLNPKQRRKELLAMKEYKVELEALHWMGMAYLSEFVLSSIQGMLDGCRDSII